MDYHWKGRGYHRLYMLEIILVLILNIALLLGFQMIFIYGDDPAQSFTATPIDTVQAEHSARYPGRNIQITAHLLPADSGETTLVIVEKHPWFDHYRTAKTITIGADETEYSGRIMCDSGFVDITVSEGSIDHLAITDTRINLAVIQVPILYALYGGGLIILEVIAYFVVRKIRGG